MKLNIFRWAYLWHILALVIALTVGGALITGMINNNDYSTNNNIDEFFGFIIVGVLLNSALAFPAYTALTRNKVDCKISPYMAFGICIPFFSVYWNFIIVNAVAASQVKSIRDKKAIGVSHPHGSGVAYSILIILSSLELAKVGSWYLGFLTLIFYIFYVVSVARCNSTLENYRTAHKGRRKPSAAVIGKATK